MSIYFNPYEKSDQLVVLLTLAEIVEFDKAHSTQHVLSQKFDFGLLRQSFASRFELRLFKAVLSQILTNSESVTSPYGLF